MTDTSTGTDYTAVTTQIRNAGQQLNSLPLSTRLNILNCLSDKILANQDQILAENAKDIENSKDHIDKQLLSRLKLTTEKISSLVQGIQQLTTLEDPVNNVLSEMEISEGLTLQQLSVPLGVILIIFEARPEVLCQCAALAIFSGNGLILKGGKEATQSNLYLHKLVQEAIDEGSKSTVCSSLITLIETREAIADLLQLHNLIDLVIPRGSNQLVTYCQKNSSIPVMGHSEGICHVYVDDSSTENGVIDVDMAVKVVVDSKTNYPSACNAMEVLLLHKNLVATESSLGLIILKALSKQHGVTLHPTEATYNAYPLVQQLVGDKSAICHEIHHEYGDLGLTVHVVDDVSAAIEFINGNGSKHTEAIVTENTKNADLFVKNIDSASVFINASTRFADGQRFGLGCEVGVSTSKLHARGPVGLKGLTTTKYVLKSDITQDVHSKNDASAVLSKGHAVGEFSDGSRQYTHKSIERD